MADNKQYVKLDYDLLHSEARKSLSLPARETYTQIKRARNSRNQRGMIINRTDDYIAFGFSDSDGMSKPTFRKAVSELIEKGFIDLVDPGGLPNRKAAYAISDNWRHFDGEGKVWD